jgi:hypothetical protein
MKGSSIRCKQKVRRKESARIGSEDDADSSLGSVPTLPEFGFDLAHTGRVRVDDLVVGFRGAAEGDEVALADLWGGSKG